MYLLALQCFPQFLPYSPLLFSCYTQSGSGERILLHNVFHFFFLPAFTNHRLGMHRRHNYSWYIYHQRSYCCEPHCPVRNLLLAPKEIFSYPFTSSLTFSLKLWVTTLVVVCLLLLQVGGSFGCVLFVMNLIDIPCRRNDCILYPCPYIPLRQIR